MRRICDRKSKFHLGDPHLGTRVEPSGSVMRRFIVNAFCLLIIGTVLRGDSVPLPLELPRPLFVGTPVPIDIPNLKRPGADRRPDFLAPAGVVNLAAGCKVTGSDPYPVIGDLEYATDGDKSGIDGSVVELMDGKQWVQIDLGKTSPLYAIVCWHYLQSARVYFDVIVQVSDDPEFKRGVTTLFNDDNDNSSGLGRGEDQAYIETFEGLLVDAKGVPARYVRLYSNGNTTDDLNHYVEVEVFGLPAKNGKN